MKDGCYSITLRNVDVLTIHNGRCYARPFKWIYWQKSVWSFDMLLCTKNLLWHPVKLKFLLTNSISNTRQQKVQFSRPISTIHFVWPHDNSLFQGTQQSSGQPWVDLDAGYFELRCGIFKAFSNTQLRGPDWIRRWRPASPTFDLLGTSPSNNVQWLLKKSCKNDCLLLLGRRWFEGLECQPWHTFEKHLLFFSKHLFTLDMILCSITIVSQCLKITFNIASEANYVYILSWQMFI